MSHIWAMDKVKIVLFCGWSDLDQSLKFTNSNEFQSSNYINKNKHKWRLGDSNLNPNYKMKARMSQFGTKWFRVSSDHLGQNTPKDN